MTVRRVMGIETEYGILQPGRPLANPMLLSSHVVAVHAAAREGARTKARWDYDDEDPLHDARGFHLQRASAHPSLLTDDPAVPAPSGDGPQALPRAAAEEYEDPGAANVILTNGARLYVDHAHPEYSSPEVTNPLDAVRWDRAGERVMLASVRALASTAALPDVALYKNNVDGKGATYGTHENYLVDRAVPFNDLAARLIPFFVTRQVFTGAGRVGLGQRGEEPGFQLSQRADYIEAEVGLETTLRRPIINTRDEPHADPDRWRRLHVIIGDATMLEVATYLRLGTTSLVLWLIERAVADGGAGGALAAIDRLALRDPVHAVHLVSHDLTLTTRLELADGRRLTALEIQREYLDAVRVGAGPRGRRAGRADGGRARPLGRRSSTGWRRTRRPARARSSGWPSCGCSRACGAATSWRGTTRGSPRSTCSGPTCGPSAGLYHRLVQADAVELLVTRRGGRPRRSCTRRGTPGRTSAARPSRATAARSPRRAGTRSCSTCRVPRRCSGCRCATRCAARTRTSGALLDRSPDAAALLEALGA